MEKRAHKVFLMDVDINDTDISAISANRRKWRPAAIFFTASSPSQ